MHLHRSLYTVPAVQYVKVVKNIRRYAQIAVLVGIVIAMGGCMTFRKSDRALEREFSESEANTVRIHRVEIGERDVRYVEAGEDTGILYFFIHGAPGSLDDFLEYVVDPTMQNAGRLVSFDRPGYGYSGFGRSERSMERHAQIAFELLQKVKGDDRVVVVSHSYGGTVALRMAVDYPGVVDRYVLIAPSVSAEDEIIFWFNRPAESVLINWMLPRAWRVANAEKTSQVENLRGIAQRLGRVEDKVVLIHGTKDSLVPVEHAYFLDRALGPDLIETTILEDEDHFLIWSHFNELRTRLLSYAAES